MPRKERQSTEVTKRFADILRAGIELLQKEGKTRKEICSGIGITPSQLSDYLNDQRSPTIDVLYKICDYLGISSDYMLGLKSNVLETALDTAADYTGLEPDTLKKLNEMRNENWMVKKLANMFLDVSLAIDDRDSFMPGLYQAYLTALCKSPSCKKWNDDTATFVNFDFDAKDRATAGSLPMRFVAESFLRDSVEKYSSFAHEIIGQAWDMYLDLVNAKDSLHDKKDD